MRKPQMKKFLVLLCCIALILLSAWSACAKPRIAVREFENKTKGDVPASAVTDMLTTELYETGNFIILEREKFDYVAEEIRLGQSGLMDPETAPEIGRVKGAQYSLTGAVTQYYYNATGGVVILPGVGGAIGSNTGYVVLEVRIIDNSSGEILYAASREGASNQTLGGLISKYGGFASGKIGGVLAAATRKAVLKHVEVIKNLSL